MLYRLLKFPASIAFWFYCRRLRTNRPEIFKIKGPLLIACNHPNSFLDAIVFSSLFKEPIYSLARGDVFKNKWVNKIFRSLNMFPVYRTSEGVENMEHNYTTFDACIEVFKKGGIVLIFSEGRCVNEWHLRPLKKGTARLALSTWEKNIPLTVLPAGINYQSFRRFGKNIDLNFGSAITKNEIDPGAGFGKSVQAFNEKLNAALKPLVYEFDNSGQAGLLEQMQVHKSSLKKIAFIIPAVAGFIFHFPLYYLVKWLSTKLGSSNDHFDSIAVGALFLLYPFYLALVFSLFFLAIGKWSLLGFIILPACGWCYMQLKNQF